MMASRIARRACYVCPARGSQKHYAQSRSCIADDTDALVRRVCGAHAHCFGNADQTRAAIDAEPRARNHRSNNAGHDRKQYRDRPLRGSQRRENGGLSLAPADNAQPTNHQPCRTDAAFRQVLLRCHPVNPRCGNEASTLLVGPVPCQYASVLSDAKNARAVLAAATRRSQSRLRSEGNAMTGESRWRAGTLAMLRAKTKTDTPLLAAGITPFLTAINNPTVRRSVNVILNADRAWQSAPSDSKKAPRFHDGLTARRTFPDRDGMDWATIQNNLGGALKLKGSDNPHEMALKMPKRKARPVTASAQKNIKGRNSPR
jgi:hypothetical protein